MNSDLETYARKALEAELLRLDAERDRVKALLASLQKGATPKVAAVGEKRPRKMSEAGRLAISEAVKRRWERVRAEVADAEVPAAGTIAPTPAAPGRRSPGSQRTGNRKK